MAREEVAKGTRRRDACVRFETSLHELVLDILPRRRRKLLAAHLKKCSACREYLRQARRLPAVLASLPAPRPPEDLAEQIKGACLVALMAPRRQAPSPVWGRISYAGATAAALLIFVALSYPPIAMRAAHHELAAVIAREPTVTVPALGDVLAGPSRAVRPAPPRPTALFRPAMLRPAPPPVRRRWESPAARVPVARSVAALPAARRAVSARPAGSHGEVRTAATHKSVAIGAPTHTAAAPTGAAEPSVDGVNGRVAHGVAAGVLAGALIEHYLADAIARRGTDLATAALVAPSAPTGTPTGRGPADAMPAAM